MAGGQLPGEPLQRGDRVVQGTQGVVEQCPDRPGAVELRLLRQVHDVVGNLRRPGVGNVPAGEQAQQRRLAGAVLADQADARPGGGDEIDAVEDGARAEGADEAVGDQRRERGGGG